MQSTTAQGNENKKYCMKQNQYQMREIFLFSLFIKYKTKRRNLFNSCMISEEWGRPLSAPTTAADAAAAAAAK